MPLRPRRFPLLLALAAAFAAAPLSAEEPASGTPVSDVVDVRVVNVEVTVTDETGAAVGGLERGDFTLFEDGRRQEITNFYAIERTRVRSEIASEWRDLEVESPFSRRMVLLIDNNTLSAKERDRSLEALHAFLDEKFDESYEWSVVAVGDEVQVVQPLTTEKFRVRAAIDRVGRMPSNAGRFAVDRWVIDDPVRIRMSQRASQTLRDQGGLNPAAPTERDLSTALRFESQVNMMRNLAGTLRTAEAMIQACRAYGNLSGKKVLVLVTGGIEMLPEYANLAGPAGGGAAGRGTPDLPADDPKIYQLHLQLRDTLERVIREANAANFTIYPIKAAGHETRSQILDPSIRSSGATFNDAAFTGPTEIDDSDSGQYLLAGGTGGLYTVHNRLLESFEEVDADSASFYSLGYSPAHLGDGEYHQIRVEAKNPRWRVRARPGYVDLTDEQRLERTLTSSLSFAKEKGKLPVRLELRADREGTIRAAAVVPMRDLEFIAQGDAEQGKVRVYLAIFGADGQAVDLIRREQELRFPAAARAEAMSQDLRYELRFSLAKGVRYTLTVTLVDELSGEMGTGLAHLAL